MIDERHELTPTQMWALIEQGVNAHEFAVWCGVTIYAAAAMMVYATKMHARLEA